MEKINDSTYQKSEYSNFGPHLNLTTIGILLFTLIITTYNSFVLTLEISLALLLLSILLLIFNNLLVRKEGLTISKVDLMWLFFLIMMILNILTNNIINSSTLLDVYIYIIALLFLVVVKVDVKYYRSSFKLIKLAGIIYAFSAIIQYVFTDFYIGYILPLFSAQEQTTILQLLSANSYAGFTGQTAYIAGYIVCGIGIIVFSNWKVELPHKLLLIVFLIVMFIGLFLTTKRSHIIFIIIAILITTLFSLNNKIFIKSMMKLIISGLTLFIIMFSLYTSFNLNGDSLFAGLFTAIDETVYGLIEGEDITSGRTTIYDYSWGLFMQSPITGIGWEEFRNSYSIGIFNNNVGSHPHNIYIQLLTELGIIGFLLFIIPLGYVYYKTYHLLRNLNTQNDASHLINWKYGIQYSFFYQTFFILYGMTGNLLSDYSFLLMYFFVCSLSVSALFKLRLPYQFNN